MSHCFLCLYVTCFVLLMRGSTYVFYAVFSSCHGLAVPLLRYATDPHVRHGCADVLVKISGVLAVPSRVSVVSGNERIMFFGHDSPDFYGICSYRGQFCFFFSARVVDACLRPVVTAWGAAAVCMPIVFGFVIWGLCPFWDVPSSVF